MDSIRFPLKSVASQFAAMAAMHPDRLAVVDHDRTITYGELDRRVTRLAEELMRRNVAVEDAVGLLLDRSIELYLGMLAAHRCGACYVPLDPAWPEKRRAFIADETRCRVILSVSTQATAPEWETRTIFLDRFDWSAATAPEENFPADDLQRLAYILYTSGSTGVPKGVEVEHAGVANFVDWQNRYFPHSGPFRTTQAARPGFDASGSEIWPALCSGSTLYVIPSELLRNIPALARWLNDHQIQECFLPTPLAELLMETGMPPHSALQILRIGGERLTRKPPADFPAIAVNEYGPTETTIACTYAVFYPGDASEPLPDIGIPIPQLELFILDDQLTPLPDGQIGEICIGGIGLARGYHRRPDLDAISFVSDPNRAGERLYRTGDLGLRNADGRFEYIGRKDFQVKLHGQRLELGEIETVIAAHPDVAKCVAILRRSDAGAQTIAAYVTLRRPDAGIVTELRTLACERLPEYMIPAVFCVMDAFPLTANGKVDRNALPEIDRNTVLNADEKSSPRRDPEGDCEKKLAALWQEQLQCSAPGRDDDFFRLGGDSLQAMLLAVKIGDAFHFDASATLLFEHPKLADLAVAVDREAETGVSSELTRGADDNRRIRFPATSYQLAQWKLQELAGVENLNNIVIAIHLDGPWDPVRLQDILETIVRSHQSLRSSFEWDGRMLWQHVAASIAVPLPFEDWSGRPSQEQQEAFQHRIIEHQRHGFDPAQPPLFQAELIRMTGRRHELLFTVSHLIFDGWSGALLFTRLRDDYQRLISGEIRPDADEYRPDYADFAWYHRKQLEDESFHKGLAAWRTMLDGFSPMPKLPFEHPDASGDRNAAGRYEFQIPETVCMQFKQFALASGDTLFTLLQAVLQIQLFHYTNVTDIVTGTAFANRKLRNSEQIIGMFINSLPLRHRLNPEENFHDFMRRFRLTVRQCAENADVPLDLILEHCRIATRNAPLFPVSLLLQNLPWPENADTELQINYDEFGSGMAKTDLMLVFEERRGALDCHVEFREALFSRESVAAFCDAFRILAENLIAHPDLPVDKQSCPLPPESRPGTYLIGDTGLVPASGDILLRSGFHIYGVFSDDPPVRRWAGEQRIPGYSPSGNNFQTIMRRLPFDYLFSIVNSHVIDETVLALPRKMAINYHDSPLPRYAGLNACCQAVIHRESEHGVTWHEIVPELDAGDICAQRLFPIPPSATAVALSLQCSEMCLLALQKFLAPLRNDTLKPRPQDLSLRTCFRASDRPYAGALLDWRRSAEELCALVRGLDLGTYENEMACAKFLCRDRMFIAGAAEIADPASPKSLSQPGVITAVDAQSITVATGKGLIKLSALRRISGEAANADCFVTGENTSLPSPYDFDALDHAYHAAARNESYWAKIMATLDPLEIPLDGWDHLPEGEERFPLEKTDEFDPAILFGMFLARLCARESIDIPLRAPGSEPSDSPLPPGFLLEYLPLRLTVDFNRNVAENHDRIQAVLERLIARRLCPGDMLLRRKNLCGFQHFSPALECDDRGDRMLCCGKERAERLLKLFHAFRDNMQEHPDMPLKAIRMQSPTEFQAEVFDWNRTDRDYPLNTTYAALFAQRLSGREARIALVAAGRTMTYGELDRYASGIALLLRRHGAMPGDVIGISAARTPELAGALLGIFKAGCAYLALEPGQFPAERRRLMLTAGNVEILLLGDPEASRADYPESLKVIDLESASQISAEPNDTSGAPFPDSGDATAYLMFTSGSTGIPKGVMVSQRNLLHHNQAVIDAFQLGPEDRVLQFGSLSFDLSVEEIFPILLAGGTLVFRPGRVPPSPAELLEYARQEHITMFDLPTAYWHGMINHLQSADLPPSLRLVVIGGERASSELLQRWREVAPDVRLLNSYGPTETTVIVTLSEDFTTIGRPIANARCYIFDRFMQPCPPGCPGEIYLGGEGVAQGYLNDPERTMRMFQPDPFHPGERIYRSGDLGCYTPDGRIVYLGRADRQVKLRGFRIELESIEAALRQIPGIADAAVVLHPVAGAGTERLDGYVVPRTGAAIDGREIMARLARTLPEYMVPATITRLNEFPLTPTGKLDRRALSAPQVLEPARTDVAPDSTLEMQLALIFQRLLGTPSVDFEQSFFQQGGDSLSALNLCLEVERICGINLGMEEFYRNPSIKGLAGIFKNSNAVNHQWSSLVLLADNGDKQPVYLIHTTPGDVLGYVNLAGLITHRRVYAFQAFGLNEANQPHRTIPEMARYYIELLRQNQPKGPYYLCGWCFGGIVAYEMACQLRESGDRVAFLGLIETWGKPPLSFHYLLRFGWYFFRMGPQKWLQYLRMKLKRGRQWNNPHPDELNFLATRFGDSLEKNKIEHLKKIYALHMDAVSHYAMRHYSGKIELFCAPLSQFIGIIPDPERRWTDLADRIRLTEIAEGNHNAILKPPTVRIVADEINASLVVADRRGAVVTVQE